MGLMVDTNDLIIAARFHDFSLLTENVHEFSRVPGLRVIPFAAA
jgi:predicted nucleic acid-binding protein